jgi:CubicO group peptidase (beta-lactamase class C family)
MEALAMQRRTAMVGAGAAMLAGTLPVAAQPAPASLDATLRPYLARFGLPAVAGAVVLQGRVVAAGAVGTRRAGTDTPVTLADRFHIGSCTKAFTALLAGILVEAGRIRWEATVGEAFPDLRTGMDAGLAGVTLAQLLSHTGGVSPDDDAIIRVLLAAYGEDSLNLDAMRRWVIGQLRARPLASPRGTRFAYANLGYMIAGAMLEAAAGATWEELVLARIAGPLGLASAGIGPQSTMGRVDAPLGHVVRPDGSLLAMLAGPNGDVPAVYGPAGAAHLSILDFAAWAGWHAGAGKRGPALVGAQTLRRLHTRVVEMPPRPDAAPGTPSGGAYGLGWGFIEMPYSRGEVMLHTGSNSMNLAMVMVQPSRDFALAVATNRPDGRADEGLKALQEALFRDFAPPG